MPNFNLSHELDELISRSTSPESFEKLLWTTKLLEFSYETCEEHWESIGGQPECITRLLESKLYSEKIALLCKGAEPTDVLVEAFRLTYQNYEDRPLSAEIGFIDTTFRGITLLRRTRRTHNTDFVALSLNNVDLPPHLRTIDRVPFVSVPLPTRPRRVNVYRGPDLLRSSRGNHLNHDEINENRRIAFAEQDSLRSSRGNHFRRIVPTPTPTNNRYTHPNDYWGGNEPSEEELIVEENRPPTDNRYTDSRIVEEEIRERNRAREFGRNLSSLIADINPNDFWGPDEPSAFALSDTSEEEPEEELELSLRMDGELEHLEIALQEFVEDDNRYRHITPEIISETAEFLFDHEMYADTLSSTQITSTFGYIIQDRRRTRRETTSENIAVIEEYVENEQEQIFFTQEEVAAEIALWNEPIPTVAIEEEEEEEMDNETLCDLISMYGEVDILLDYSLSYERLVEVLEMYFDVLTLHDYYQLMNNSRILDRLRGVVNLPFGVRFIGAFDLLQDMEEILTIITEYDEVSDSLSANETEETNDFGEDLWGEPPVLREITPEILAFTEEYIQNESNPNENYRMLFPETNETEETEETNELGEPIDVHGFATSANPDLPVIQDIGLIVDMATGLVRYSPHPPTRLSLPTDVAYITLPLNVEQVDALMYLLNNPRDTTMSHIHDTFFGFC